MKIRNVYKVFVRIFRVFVIIWFVFSFTGFVLSFTTLPFWAWHKLSQRGNEYSFQPEYIIVMANNGMPSQSNLMNIYQTAMLTKRYPHADIVVAIPEDSTSEMVNSCRILDEMIFRGIDSTKIYFENEGRNTRAQALNILRNICKSEPRPILIVSSPEHIYRTVRVFEKLGFDNAGSYPCFDNTVQNNLAFDAMDLGGNKAVPDIGANQQLRYQFWNHLKYEIIVLREYAAIFYYELQGWI